MIPNRPAFFLALALMAVAGVATLGMAGLWGSSVLTVGEVASIETRTVSCGRSSPPCTEFSGTVRYEAHGQGYTTRVALEVAPGPGRPASDARHRIGSRVPIRYVRWSPATTVPETSEAAFACPSSAAVLGLVALLASFLDPRSRRRFPLSLG